MNIAAYLVCVPMRKLWLALTILRSVISRHNNEWLLATSTSLFLSGRIHAAPVSEPGFPFDRRFPVTVGCLLDYASKAFSRKAGLWSRPSRQVAHESSSKDSLTTAFRASASYPQLLQGWSIELLPRCWSQRMRTKTSKDSGQWDQINTQSTVDQSHTWISLCGVNHMDQHVFSPFQFCWEF